MKPRIAETHDRHAGCTSSTEQRSQDANMSLGKILFGLTAVVALVAVYWILHDTGFMSILTDEQRLRSEVSQLGFGGGLALIGLIALAIVMSPIPSGPIAIVAGAVYGPLLGAVYVVTGSVLGAVIAFGLARCLGYDFVCRRLGDRLSWLTEKRSQLRLMAAVFASRLILFISFDAVSYAAGLTPLSFWRFLIATFFGVIPISVLLTYSGEWLISLQSHWATIIVTGVSLVTVIPIAVHLLRSKHRKRERSNEQRK
jgi:uncharacterized membrane protein YdjX (TVP38/TMEM64 family)